MNLYDLFWRAKSDTTQFELYSAGHVIALLITLSLIVLMYLGRHYIRKNETRKTIGIILGITLALQQTLLFAWYVNSGNFTVGESLPLYLCRLSAILCIFMTITGKRELFDIAYFWGMGGAAIALLNPDTSGFGFPHIMYLQFFVGHGGIIVSLFFMMFAYRFIPDWNSLKRTFKWSFVYLFIVGGLNYIVKGNYSYLREKPLTSSPLDILPAYPYYVPIMVAFMFAFFTLLYIPFLAYNKKAKKDEFMINSWITRV